MASVCSIVATELGVVHPGGHVTLKGINLECSAGSLVSIVGPSGCGKSTLLRCVASLQPRTSGSIRLESALPRPARIGFVFQDPNLLPWRDVEQNIALPLELQRVGRRECEQRVAEAQELVGLRAEDRKKLPKMLSGGMRMRVSFARAIVTDPDVMLMDEPFAALDDISRHQLNEELIRLWMDQGWTSLFVTHNVAEAVFLSQRVLVMATRPGRVAAEIDVPFSYPRDEGLRATPEFAALTGRISRSLREVGS